MSEAKNSLMKNKKNIFTLRLINILLFVLLVFVQYNATFSIKIAHANPMLPLALLVAICMFCSELTGAISGLIVGIFIDSTASTTQGFNATVFMILGLCVTLIIRHLFNNNIFSAVTLCLLCSAVYYLIRWIFYYIGSVSLTENLTYLMQTILPSVLYTAVFIIPFYYLERYLYKKFYK